MGSQTCSQALRVLLYFLIGYLYYGLVWGWTVVDCIYFSTAIVTTVGYGDVTPPVEDVSLLFTWATCLLVLSSWPWRSPSCSTSSCLVRYRLRCWSRRSRRPRR